MNYQNMVLKKSLEYGFEEKKTESQMRPLKDHFSGTLEEKKVFYLYFDIPWIYSSLSFKYYLLFFKFAFSGSLTCWIFLV